MSTDPRQPSQSPAPPSPPPLTADETRRLWRWERAQVRLAAMAIMVLAAALGAAHVYGDDPLIRRGALGLGILFLVGVVVMQLRERCPRCGARLAHTVALTLPPACPRCGVAFPRPMNPDAELDN